MIYTELSSLERYFGIGEYLDTAINYLCSHSLEEFEAGHYEISGDYVYLNVFDYETIPEEQGFFEAHEKYADIHMTITGEEIVGVSDRAKVTVKSWNKEADLIEVEGVVEHYMKLSPGKVLVTLPEDAHKVKLAAGQPSPVKKAVVKVYLGTG